MATPKREPKAVKALIAKHTAAKATRASKSSDWTLWDRIFNRRQGGGK